MFKMNRKAVSVLLMVFEILAVLFLGWMAIKMATAAAGTSAIEKINLANDLVLSVNTLASYPGEGFLQYPLNQGYNLSFYAFSLAKDGVIVLDKSETGKAGADEETAKKDVFLSAKRSLFLPQDFSLTGEITNKETFYIIKEGKKIYLSDRPPSSLNTQKAQPEGKVIAQKIIFAPAGETADLISALISASLAKETKSSPEEGAIYLFLSEMGDADTLKIQYASKHLPSQILATAIFNQAKFQKKELLPAESVLTDLPAIVYLTFPFGEAAKIAIPLEKALNEVVQK